MTQIFYHTDTDGHLAGYLASQFLVDHSKPFTLDEIDYGMDFPLEAISPDSNVIIVDFSLPSEVMAELMSKINDHKNILWIDHHKSAIERYEKEFPAALEVLPGIRYVGLCGAMLTWIYLYGYGDTCNYEDGTVVTDGELIENTAKHAPVTVKLVNDHDVWNYEYGAVTSYFQTYVRSVDSSPMSGFWFKLGGYGPTRQPVANYVNSFSTLGVCIDKGRIMSKYKRAWEADYVKKMSFETEFHGYTCLAVNTALANMSFFDSVRSSKYDMYIVFAHNGTNFTYSLYSETIDVAKIAEEYGGGGHKGAAGFRSDELLIKKTETK